MKPSAKKDALARTIREAVCECGHGILSDHVDRCNAPRHKMEGAPEDRLRNAIFGEPCPCERSDADLLADLFTCVIPPGEQ